MTDPTITGAGIGGVIVATFWGITKLVPVIAKVVKPINSKGKLNTVRSMEFKPGKADICIERGEELVRHNQILINLVNETGESKEDRKDIKDKLTNGFQRIYDKLDGK